MDQEKIGKFIAKLRKNKNMTQEALAERLGVNSKSISRWETGKCMPDLSLLVPLSKELGMGVNDLLSGKENAGEEYQAAFEKNIVNIANKAKNDNRKFKFKTLYITLSIIFIIIPMLVLCMSQFLKLDFLPSFSSFKIMNKANQFYQALQNNDINKIDQLMTDNVDDEMCWYSIDGDQTKQNFLDNLKAIKKFPRRVQYTSFKVNHFNYTDSSGTGWQYGEEPDDPNSISVSSCSPKPAGFKVAYELCFTDWTAERACIILTFVLNDAGKLTFMADSRDINLSENAMYKKYRPIYYPLSINNSAYNSLHVFIGGVFSGYSLENIEKGVESWLQR